MRAFSISITDVVVAPTASPADSSASGVQQPSSDDHVFHLPDAAAQDFSYSHATDSLVNKQVADSWARKQVDDAEDNDPWRFLGKQHAL